MIKNTVKFLYYFIFNLVVKESTLNIDAIVNIFSKLILTSQKSGCELYPRTVIRKNI